MQKLQVLWESLYGQHPDCQSSFQHLVQNLTRYQMRYRKQREHQLHFEATNAHEGQTLPHANSEQGDWHKDAVIYSLYVDKFADNFAGLSSKLSYLKDLGVSCVWVLPILDSPMHDDGFDIRDYRALRKELFPEGMDEAGRDAMFDTLLYDLHRREMRLVFDIALNHCSAEHPWFIEACKSESSPTRKWFYWNKEGKGFDKAPVIFSDRHSSNWTKPKDADSYYFHTFYAEQPDLNYHEPSLLLEVLDILLYWQARGVDGFRLDAAAHYWKEEGTNCQNLAQTHLIIRIMRRVLDLVKQGTILVAEVCQPMPEQVKYFGTGDECHAAYNFHQNFRTFLSLARGESFPLYDLYSSEREIPIPSNAHWFNFLRSHDELILNLEGPELQHELMLEYGLYKSWEFRNGIGLAARCADLLQDPERVLLAHALLIALPGSPVLYYGDEFFTQNDETWAQARKLKTGIDDARYRLRGPLDWKSLQNVLTEREGDAGLVYGMLRRMLRVYREQAVFRRGSFRLLPAFDPSGVQNPHILYFERILDSTILRASFNFSHSWQEFRPVDRRVLLRAEYDILEQPIGAHGDYLVIPPYGFYLAVAEGWKAHGS